MKFILLLLMLGVPALAATPEANVRIVKEFKFNKPAGKIGINVFAIPFKPGSEVSTIGKFISKVNETAKEGVVAGFGYYDNDQQKLSGIVIRPDDYQGLKIDESGIITYGDVLAREFLRRKMVMDQPYQITVLFPVSIKLSGER